MKVLLCIDDTDNLESIGTGEMLENLCALLAKEDLAETGFVTRHQLFLHEDIRYTSHNSSMCCEIKLKEEDLERVLRLAGRYLEDYAAEGSDPGLCVVLHKKLEDAAELIRFGKRAKSEVLQKEDAYELAEKYAGLVYLSEHGGTGDGIIGAIAGCGLRLYGNDGRVKGKISPKNPGEVVGIGEFCKANNLEKVFDVNFNPISKEEDMICQDSFKAIMVENQPAMILTGDPSGRAKWTPVDKKQLNKGGLGR